MRTAALLTIFLLALIATSAQATDHSTWSRVLSRVVDARGFVDYDALLADREEFDRYLAYIENTGPSTDPLRFPDNNSKLAFYLNAYNALVFSGVLERGTQLTSVWGDLISELSFFRIRKVKIDGQITHLQTIEDVLIRESFADPRIHAALNCASISCPRLPRVAFTAADLDKELDTAMREFVNDSRNVRIDYKDRIVFLSRIFDWYEGDFIEFEERSLNSAPTVMSYINRFLSHGQKIPATYKIDYLDYDKRLNRQLND